MACLMKRPAAALSRASRANVYVCALRGEQSVRREDRHTFWGILSIGYLVEVLPYAVLRRMASTETRRWRGEYTLVLRQLDGILDRFLSILGRLAWCQCGLGAGLVMIERIRTEDEVVKQVWDESLQFCFLDCVESEERVVERV
jgi:hypothetical protein